MTHSDRLPAAFTNTGVRDGTGPEQPVGGELMMNAASALPSTSRLVAVAGLAGLAAGLVSWLAGESVVNAFLPPLQSYNMMGHVLMKATFADQVAADYKNATLAFAVLGGVMGAALGMAGGIARRSLRAGMRGATAGLVAGGNLGALASLLVLPVYFHKLDVAQEELSRDLVLPVMVHLAIWAACGLAGGLAFGIGLDAGRAARSMPLWAD